MIKDIFCVISVIYSTLYAQTITDSLPHSFQAGDTARAEDVIDNFAYLLSRINTQETKIDSMTTALNQTIASLHDSLSDAKQGTLSLRDSLQKVELSLSDSIARVRKLCFLPVGTIIASTIQPAKFKEMLGTDSALWVLADGSESTEEYLLASQHSTIPDARGLFLRGLNAGRNDGNE
ncbi:MAG: hypothetical protein GF350_11565, partial [Chitinivibrionales bacterium]|nr:hypothetical protein [Chitinivibrionales bacterium]